VFSLSVYTVLLEAKLRCMISGEHLCPMARYALPPDFVRDPFAIPYSKGSL